MQHLPLQVWKHHHKQSWVFVCSSVNTGILPSASDVRQVRKRVWKKMHREGLTVEVEQVRRWLNI